MDKTKKQKRLDDIKIELLSSEEVLVKKGLKRIQKQGDHTLIDTLLTAYMSPVSEELKMDMHIMLSSLKVSKAEDVLIEALKKPEFKDIQGDILSFIWNSGFQPLDHIHTITEVAINGDYMTALEALTLAENMEGTFLEELILESTVEIRNYLNQNSSDDKVELIINLQQVISSYVVE